MKTIITTDAGPVREATDLRELIAEHVELCPKGREHVGLCPFHDDHTPSLTVVTHKGNPFYKCHACGAVGDAFNFVMDYHKMTFAEALRFLAERAGLSTTGRRNGNHKPARRTSRIMCRRAGQQRDYRPLAAFFYRDLWGGRPGVPDLDSLAGSLGVSAESLSRLGVGWFDPQQRRRWPDSEATELTRRWLDEKRIWPAWSFPMSNGPGHIVGIRLRSPGGGKFSVRGSCGSALFVPSDLTGDGPLLLTEGATDCASLLTLGFDSIGRANCWGGAHKLRSYCRGRNVVVVSDRDAVGRNGARAIGTLLFGRCASVCIIEPPVPHKDVRAWVQAGATVDDVRALIETTEPLKGQVIAA